MQFYARHSFQHYSIFIKEYDVIYRIVSGTNYKFQDIVKLWFFSAEFSELWIPSHINNLGLLVWKLNAFQNQC